MATFISEQLFRRNVSRSANTGSSQTTRLSSTSKRQRGGTGHAGAFGKRTGDLDIVFLEGILPESRGVVLSDHSTKEQTSTCFDRLKSVLSDRFDGTYPPRTTIGVCSLPGDAAVQFDVIAAAE